MSADARRQPAAGAAAALAATGALVALAVLVLVAKLDMAWSVLTLALALFLPIAVLVWRNLGAHPHRRFGPANVVSVLRGGMAAAIGAVLFESERFAASGGDALLWGLVGVALVALALDGVDGFLARRTGLASPFGERLDMEIDAFLILVLCALAYASGKAGAFVFLIGLMRYGFVLWASLDPRLSRPLPPSLRRKTVCVLQIALLCLALLPPVEPPVSSTLAALALALLSWSFVVDVRWLLQRPAPAPARAAAR